LHFKIFLSYFASCNLIIINSSINLNFKKMKMTKFYIVALLALVFASCGPKEPVAKVAEALPEYRERWDSLTVIGMVTDVKKESREITLMGTNGDLLTVVASDEIQRFDEIAQGDVITFGYIRYLKAEFRQPTPEEIANPLTVVAEAAKAPEGLDPTGAAGAIVKGVVTIEVLNRPFMRATVKGPNGNYLTLPLEDAALLEKLHIGQVLVLTYAELKVTALSKM
jgi:hypothetical protein